MRRRALLIIWFAMPDQAPGEVKKGEETETLDFLVTEGFRQRRRPSFVTIELLPGENILDSLRRHFPSADSAITSSPQELTRLYVGPPWQAKEVVVFELGVGHEQRHADLYEQAADMRNRVPILSWHEAGWLFRQAEDEALDQLSRTVLFKPTVQEFLRRSRARPRQAA